MAPLASFGAVTGGGNSVGPDSDQVVPRAKELGLRLGIETRMRLEDIPDEEEISELLKRYAPVTSYWHDVGHAQIKENLGLTSQEFLLNRFRGQTAGMHLQDFAPPAADHLPPGQGTFEFVRLAPYITADMVLAWEIHPEWPADQIADAMRQTQELLLNPVTV